jgi:hypothetical protein
MKGLDWCRCRVKPYEDDDGDGEPECVLLLVPAASESWRR